MRILHIWDVCDNSQYLTDKLVVLGHQSKVITRKEYSRKNLPKYYLKVIFHLLIFKADIIHINSWDKGILFAKIFSPKSKIIMHYHGSDILDKRVSLQVPLRVRLLANKICFSTKNLIDPCSPFESYLLPVIVPKTFRYKGGREKGVIILIDKKTANINYELMPFVLSLGEYFRDWTIEKITNFEILSKTGMEAIQCGTKVITDSGEMVESFPMTELKDYYGIYNELGAI